MPGLLMVDLASTELSPLEKKIVAHPNVGAIILFSHNFKDHDQLKKLITEIHNVNPELFIAVDHEGGYVQRLQRDGLRSLPAARVYGDLYDIDAEAAIKLARKYGEIMAKDLIACGVDLSLAPVIDLHGPSNVIGKLDRAFHSSADKVAIIAEQFIDGMHAAGMPSTGKHFLGHGSCLLDSHIAKPVNTASWEKLQETDLKPFTDLIKKHKLDAIMPAHIIYENIDPENTAGFSKICLQKILRTALKFKGLIISDCLSMQGADVGDMKTRAQRAMEAGCDMLIVSHQPREALYELVQSIDFKQTEDKQARLTTFKAQMKRFKTEEELALSHNSM